MNHILLRRLISFFFIATVIVSLAAQNQYVINREENRLNLIIEKDTKFTVANILEKKGQPLPESKTYSIDINMDTIGDWSLSSTEKVWKLNISVPRAKEFFISFSDFYLPVGAKLYAYNSTDPQNAYVFQHEDNPKGGAYSLENMKGDNVVLEYVTSTTIKENPKIHFLRLGYKYLDDLGEKLSGFNSTANRCMINVNCPQGENWKAQKRGVVQLRVLKSDKKTYLCSGTLINNTSNDKTPYILTANHCFENMVKDEIEQTEFFFEYESPICEENILPTYKYHKGSELLILNPLTDGSDGSLLKLTEAIPEAWDVYFNGWDRTNRAKDIESGSVIHHPLGDVKKITIFDKAPEDGKWEDEATVNTHWILKYSQGVTAGGSSGSPMFNSKGLVVGTLTGGESSCNRPTYSDYYGKFWYHWDQYPNTKMHMNKYLDPSNTGAEYLVGLYNNENAIKELLLEKYNVNLMYDVSFNIRIFDGNGGYSVTSSDGNIASADIENNTIKIRTYKPGVTTVNITDKKQKTKKINIAVHKYIDLNLGEDKILNVGIFKEDDSLKQISIIDLDGNTLYKTTSFDSEKQHSINTQAFRKGLYILQVKTKKGTTRSEKIIW